MPCQPANITRKRTPGLALPQGRAETWEVVKRSRFIFMIFAPLTTLTALAIHRTVCTYYTYRSKSWKVPKRTSGQF